MKENKFYLLACLARSYDDYHLINQKIHLIMSVFYTKEDRIEKLKNFNFKAGQIIIRVRSEVEDNTPIVINQLNESTVEIIISLYHFLGVDGIVGFNNFIEKLIGDHYSKNRELKGNLLNSTLFVFENINWSTLQYFFKLFNINISGGSTTNRHILSTAEFNLCTFLLRMEYDLYSIYDSKLLFLRKKEDIKYKDTNYIDVKVDMKLLKEIVNREVNKSKENLIKSKTLIEENIAKYVKAISETENNFKDENLLELTDFKLKDYLNKDQPLSTVGPAFAGPISDSTLKIGGPRLQRSRTVAIPKYKLEIDRLKQKLIEFNNIEIHLENLINYLDNKNEAIDFNILRDLYFKLYQERNKFIYKDKFIFESKLEDFRINRSNRFRKLFKDKKNIRP